MSDFRPLPPKSEFREAGSLLKPSQKKPRKSSSNTPKDDLRHSPFGGGSLSNSPSAHSSRQAILQDFRQGEAKQSPTRRDSSESRAGPVTSHFFPNARINESTSEQTGNRRASVGRTFLRTQHRPAPKPTQPIPDSNSADELAISPPRKGLKSPSKQKRKQAANSGVKRNARGKAVEDSWPLSFARSSDFEGKGSTSEDGHATLVLKTNELGLRVQVWDSVNGWFETPIIVYSKDINKVLADGTSRLRLQGPRTHDGNSGIFDLEFARTLDFFRFLDDHVPSITITGKYVVKPE
jgi:sentrin-specific protease 7